jgi:hypothetical protein
MANERNTNLGATLPSLLMSCINNKWLYSVLRVNLVGYAASIYVAYSRFADPGEYVLTELAKLPIFRQ